MNEEQRKQFTKILEDHNIGFISEDIFIFVNNLIGEIQIKDQAFLKNMYAICEMLLKNASHSSGIDFAILNDTLIQLREKLSPNTQN